MYKRWIKRQPAEHKPISCERKTERETSRANKSENLPKTKNNRDLKDDRENEVNRVVSAFIDFHRDAVLSD